MRELMRSYIEQRRQARAYDDDLRLKVEAGRALMRADRGRSDNDVEAVFAARRNQAAPRFGTTSRPKTPAQPFKSMCFSVMRPPGSPRIRTWVLAEWLSAAFGRGAPLELNEPVKTRTA